MGETFKASEHFLSIFLSGYGGKIIQRVFTCTLNLNANYPSRFDTATCIWFAYGGREELTEVRFGKSYETTYICH